MQQERIYYVEDCFCLTPKRIDDSLNRIGRKIGDNSDFQRADIKYDYAEEDGQYFMIATVVGNAPQKIAVEITETAFGERQYFLCEECDRRCHKLFLLPGGSIFRCRICSKIRYRSFNTSSRHGQLYDTSRRILKLMNEQENMTSRIWYRDAHTKRYSKFLNKCLKAGLTDLVVNARAVESAIINTNS